MEQEECLPLVNENGQVIGRAARSRCHDGSKLLHPVVHLHVFDEAGRLYLQKRSLSKDFQPGKWDTAVGGHVDWGETIDDALRREAREELGLTDFTPLFIARYIFESTEEKELVHSFRTIYNGLILPNPDELDGGCFRTIAQIRTLIAQGLVTPNFEAEFQRYLVHLLLF